METSAMPFLTAPQDALRHGLVTLKDGATASHPVETVQKAATSEQDRLQMLQRLYGSALPARMHIEKQILDRVTRLPGLPSSKLGAEAMSGTLDEFSFESYLGLPSESEAAPPDMHSVMETKLGMGPTTKPCARGII